MRKYAVVCVAVTALFLLAACTNPASSANSTNSGYTTNGGSITLELSDNGVAKTVEFKYGPGGPYDRLNTSKHSVTAYQSSTGGDSVYFEALGGTIFLYYFSGKVTHDFSIGGSLTATGTTVGSTVSATITCNPARPEFTNLSSTLKVTKMTVTAVPIVSVQ